MLLLETTRTGWKAGPQRVTAPYGIGLEQEILHLMKRRHRTLGHGGVAILLCESGIDTAMEVFGPGAAWPGSRRGGAGFDIPADQ